MWRTAIVLLVSIGAVAAQEKPAPKAATAKVALLEFFKRAFSSAEFKRRAKSASVEICHDLCEEYRARRSVREAELWDLAFLHQYYFSEFIGMEEFREANAELSTRILNSYSGDCSASDVNEQATCVVDGLAKKLAVEYWMVRGDEGQVCGIRHHLTQGGTIGETVCRDPKKGRK
jgi:hypothetical protein